MENTEHIQAAADPIVQYMSKEQLQKSMERTRKLMQEAENPHDLLIAETKANVALQYTVAVRDKLIDGYKEIMQMSI